jgi:hypothetical protein
MIPPVPLKSKLGVTFETLVLLGLGTAIYLDYANNVYLQSYVTQTYNRILAGINVWTGVILAITSFSVTYLLLRARLSSSSGSHISFLNSLKKRFHKARLPSIALTVSPPAASSIVPATVIVNDTQNVAKTTAPPLDDDKKTNG